VSGENTLLFCALYSGGVSVHRVGDDGTLSEHTDVSMHPKDGMPLKHPRQELPHAHGVAATPDGFLYCTDLGRNSIFVYRVDYPTGKLNRLAEVKLSRDGAGPRHLAVGDGRVFCVCELDNTVVAFDVDAATGGLTETGWASILPEGWDAPKPFPFYEAPSHAAGICYDAAAGRVYVVPPPPPHPTPHPPHTHTFTAPHFTCLSLFFLLLFIFYDSAELCPYLWSCALTRSLMHLNGR
jgi:hypothetical protein